MRSGLVFAAWLCAIGHFALVGMILDRLNEARYERACWAVIDDAKERGDEKSATECREYLLRHFD
jgi:hypothetical protein